MPLPSQLEADLAALRAEGLDIEVTEDGTRYYLVFRNFRLPDGRYAQASTDLMLMADYQYPQSAMDMFWTDPRVTCPDGRLPQKADVFETYAGRTWQRWSWHYSGWHPVRHSVSTHFDVVRNRLACGS